MADPTVSVVVTVSGQSVASLAVAHNLTTTAAAHKLAAFFRGLGVKAVFDVSSGRDLALQETAAEFVWRFREEQSELQGTNRRGSNKVSECSMTAIIRPLPLREAARGAAHMASVPNLSCFDAVMHSLRSLWCRVLVLVVWQRVFNSREDCLHCCCLLLPSLEARQALCNSFPSQKVHNLLSLHGQPKRTPNVCATQQKQRRGERPTV